MVAASMQVYLSVDTWDSSATSVAFCYIYC